MTQWCYMNTVHLLFHFLLLCSIHTNTILHVHRHKHATLRWWAELQQESCRMSPHQETMHVGCTGSGRSTDTLTHTQTLCCCTHRLDETAGPDTAETIQSEIVINGIRISHSLVPLRDWMTLKCVNPQTYLTQRRRAFHPLS